MYPKRAKWFHDPIWETILWTLIVLGSCVILALFAQSKSRAGWDPKHEVYRTCDAASDVWSPPKHAPWQAHCDCCPGCACSDCACPTVGPCCEPCPCAVQSALPKWMTHGVQVERLNGHERYTLNGREVSDAQVPNDAARNRLVIIGSDAEQKRVSDDLNKHPALAPLMRDLVVQSYRPDHWHVAGAGYDTSGHPSIYLVSADGKVLSHSSAYAGPERLAEAIRKADPKYDPSKDPDLTKSQSQTNTNLPLYVMGGLYLLFLLLGKRS
jgi:hypothetical protein